MRLVAIVLVLLGCGGDPAPPEWRRAASAPAPIANNAVAAVEAASGCTLFSAMGIGGLLTAADIVSTSFSWAPGDAVPAMLPNLPGTPRVAATAVGLRGKLYVLGGYSVQGIREVSFDALDIFDPTTGQWSSGPPMPVPIDDQVAVAWRDRWIVVVSGWSNTGSVDAVQIYDANTSSWTTGTPFPGTTVFGHAGALAGDTLLIADGAADQGGFALVNQLWKGTLDPEDPTTIVWTDLGPHVGPARYRAAAGVAGDVVWFHGGTDDPYNFNGLSYDTGRPSVPLGTTLIIDPVSGAQSLDEIVKPVPTMDHRGLVGCDDRLYTIGGMIAGPSATAEVWEVGI